MSNLRATAIPVSAAAVHAACGAPARKLGAYDRRDTGRSEPDAGIRADDARMARDARRGSAILLARLMQVHPERFAR